MIWIFRLETFTRGGQHSLKIVVAFRALSFGTHREMITVELSAKKRSTELHRFALKHCP